MGWGGSLVEGLAGCTGDPEKVNLIKSECSDMVKSSYFYIFYLYS